eukprot:1126497-Pelagomonas_calceolata.AAC.1
MQEPSPDSIAKSACCHTTLPYKHGPSQLHKRGSHTVAAVAVVPAPAAATAASALPLSVDT